MWPSLLLFHKVKFKGATVMTRMWPIMPTVLWQSSAVSSISLLGPVCRMYGSPVWASPSQNYIWSACALLNTLCTEQRHREGCEVWSLWCSGWRCFNWMWYKHRSGNVAYVSQLQQFLEISCIISFIYTTSSFACIGSKGSSWGHISSILRMVTLCRSDLFLPPTQIWIVFSFPMWHEWLF